MQQYNTIFANYSCIRFHATIPLKQNNFDMSDFFDWLFYYAASMLYTAYKKSMVCNCLIKDLGFKSAQTRSYNM